MVTLLSQLTPPRRGLCLATEHHCDGNHAVKGGRICSVNLHPSLDCPQRGCNLCLPPVHLRKTLDTTCFGAVEAHHIFMYLHDKRYLWQVVLIRNCNYFIGVPQYLHFCTSSFCRAPQCGQIALLVALSDGTGVAGGV